MLAEGVVAEATVAEGVVAEAMVTDSTLAEGVAAEAGGRQTWLLGVGACGILSRHSSVSDLK